MQRIIILLNKSRSGKLNKILRTYKLQSMDTINMLQRRQLNGEHNRHIPITIQLNRLRIGELIQDLYNRSIPQNKTGNGSHSKHMLNHRPIRNILLNKSRNGRRSKSILNHQPIRNIPLNKSRNGSHSKHTLNRRLMTTTPKSSQSSSLSGMLSEHKC
jgi:hypothetical protein